MFLFYGFKLYYLMHNIEKFISCFTISDCIQFIDVTTFIQKNIEIKNEKY